jgi:hypothetical protein
MQTLLSVVVIALMLIVGNSLLISTSLRPKSCRLFASDGAGADPLDAIRARMASDPSFDPLKDPQTMQILESKIPTEMRDASISVERARVAFKDASEGTAAVADLDAAAAKFGNNQGLISSPQSAWFKNGQPNETNGAFNEAKKQDLFNKLKSQYPEVPLK